MNGEGGRGGGGEAQHFAIVSDSAVQSSVQSRTQLICVKICGQCFHKEIDVYI